MTLYELLSMLKNDDVKADITDTDGNHVCKIFTQGADALDKEYKSSNVISWEIKDRVTINVVIDMAIPSA